MKDTTNLIQYYVDRFNDAVKSIDVQVETDVVLSILEDVKELIRLQKENKHGDIDITMFVEQCLRLLEGRIDRIKPDIFIQSFE
jgi:hypothetical protein